MTGRGHFRIFIRYRPASLGSRRTAGRLREKPVKTKLLAVVVGTAALGAAALALANAQTPVPGASAPIKVENFHLPDHTSRGHELFYYRNSPAIVIITTVNGSDAVRAAAPALRKLGADASRSNVPVFLLNSNPSDERAAIAAEVRSLALDLPVLIDQTQLIGESLGVSREAEAIVINPKTWTIVYRGPISKDLSGADSNSGRADYVANVVESLVAGRPVQVTDVKLDTPEIGFPLRDNASSFARISYSEEIAPILSRNCVACHSEGSIAPFAFDSYEKVKGFAPMIREAVRTDRMPPYDADPHVGKFVNAQNLSAAEQQTLVHWVEAGAPRGDGPDPLKVNAKPAPEWDLGPPDLIVEIPAYTVPASGVVDYQDPVVDNPLTEGRWVRAIQVKPGDRRVVHHVVSDGVGNYAVGAETQIYTPGTGTYVEHGRGFRYSMHYTPYGKETVDKTRVGFWFYPADKPPEIIRRKVVLTNPAIRIPAGQARHEEVVYLTFPEDATLFAAGPHAHYRGASTLYSILEPGSKEEKPLLATPRFDFNWQRLYDFAEPVKIKAGSKLISRYVFDNSTNNRANPDPTITVTWGEQSWEEMQYDEFHYRWDDETVASRRDDYQARLLSSRTLGSLDSNVDGKVSKSEIRGRMADQLNRRWDDLDKDNDGFLDAAELEPVSGNMQRQFGQAQNFEQVTE